MTNSNENSNGKNAAKGSELLIKNVSKMQKVKEAPAYLMLDGVIYDSKFEACEVNDGEVVLKVGKEQKTFKVDELTAEPLAEVQAKILQVKFKAKQAADKAKAIVKKANDEAKQLEKSLLEEEEKQQWEETENARLEAEKQELVELQAFIAKEKGKPIKGQKEAEAKVKSAEEAYLKAKEAFNAAKKALDDLAGAVPAAEKRVEAIKASQEAGFIKWEDRKQAKKGTKKYTVQMYKNTPEKQAIIDAIKADIKPGAKVTFVDYKTKKDIPAELVEYRDFSDGYPGAIVKITETGTRKQISPKSLTLVK